MNKLNPHTKLMFFNKKLGFVGYNTVMANLSNNYLSGIALENLEKKGYYEYLDDELFIQLKVVQKDIPKPLRNIFTSLREDAAYEKVLKFFKDKNHT